MAMLMKGLVSHTERVRIHNESHAKQSPLGAVASHYKPPPKKGKVKMFSDYCKPLGVCRDRKAHFGYAFGRNYAEKRGDAKEMQKVLSALKEVGLTKHDEHFVAGITDGGG